MRRKPGRAVMGARVCQGNIETFQKRLLGRGRTLHPVWHVLMIDLALAHDLFLRCVCKSKLSCKIEGNTLRHPNQKLAGKIEK